MWCWTDSLSFCLQVRSRPVMFLDSWGEDVVLLFTRSCVVTACAFDTYQAREHLYHSPNDAVWGWFTPHRCPGKDVPASCSHRGQHVSLDVFSCLVVHTQSHTSKYSLHTNGYLSQYFSALFVGDGNVSVLRHRHVPGDSPAPGCIHRQHRGRPLFAQRPGTM